MASDDALSVLLTVVTASAALVMGSVSRRSSSPRHVVQRESAASAGSRGGGIKESAADIFNRAKQLGTALTRSAPRNLVSQVQPDAKIIPIDMWDVINDIANGKLERNDIRAVATLSRMGYSNKLPEILHSAYSSTPQGSQPTPTLYFLHRVQEVKAPDGTTRQMPSTHGEVATCNLHEQYKDAMTHVKDGTKPNFKDILHTFNEHWPIPGMPRIVTFAFQLNGRKIVVFCIPGTETKINRGDLLVDGSAYETLRTMFHMVPRGMTLVAHGDSIDVGTKTPFQVAQDMLFAKMESKVSSMRYHPGFCSHGGNAFDMIKTYLAKSHSENPPDEVWFYGHSLGGASAMVATGALWHAYDHKLGHGPAMEARAEPTFTDEQSQEFLDRYDSTKGVMRDDNAQGDAQEDHFSEGYSLGDGAQGATQDDSMQGVRRVAELQENDSSENYSSDEYSSDEYSSDEHSSDEEEVEKFRSGGRWMPRLFQPQTPSAEEQVSLNKLNEEFDENMGVLIEGMRRIDDLPMKNAETIPHIHCMALAAPNYAQDSSPLSPDSSKMSDSFTMTNFINQGDGVIFNRAMFLTKPPLSYPASCEEGRVGDKYGVVRFGILDARNDSTYPCNRMGWVSELGKSKPLDVIFSELGRFVHGHFMNKDGFVCVNNSKEGVEAAEKLLLKHGFQVRIVEKHELKEGLVLNAE